MNDCRFCGLVKGTETASVIHQDKDCLAMMDLFPISPGHLLIVPTRHVERFDELTLEELDALSRMTHKLSAAVMLTQLKANQRPDGYNILNNNGTVAQQHLPHLHIHIIPRYKRDLLKVTGHLFLHAPGLFIAKARRKRLDEQAQLLGSSLAGL